MPDYDFSGLSSRSFEHLVQSLTIKVLGPGVTIFGDGPDGGREATYEGKMNFPSTAELWEGYCVVQAKFRQRPKNTQDDGEWALKELEEELKKFADPKRALRKPDYYIFATNVVLSPVSETGKKDKAAALFKKYAKKMPLRGYAIWDYDQISRFLDDHEAIRQSYAAWITPGDVLSEVLGWFKASRPDFGEVLANFLAKEFAAEQFARLTQAGQAADERLRLASVFIDLPVSKERVVEPPTADSKEQDAGFAAQIVEIARDCFAPQLGADHPATSGGDPQRWPKPAVGRYVLVGGPGQGKTTVSQFICQLFRAAFLRDRDPNTLSSPVSDALSEFVASCEKHDTALPKVRRFPLRVALNEFATELSKAKPGSEPSLLSYFVTRIAKRTDREISPDDFRKWLKAYPWVLVLDGLDEVPATSNRDEVLQKIEEFWTDAAQCNADVLTIATTRPQGYNDDFSPQYYQHLWLTPLSTEQALVYADRLGHSKYGDDDDERERIVLGLSEAASNATTGRLMRSPLQITIMFILVESGGIPPQDRWRLFNEYYQTIYRREKQRPIPAAALLRDYEKNMDVIHTRVALLLQVESERRGGTEAIMPRDRFARVVEDHLAEEGIEGEQLARVTREIIEAVEERLVFLVGVQDEQIGFEIASLREFMAAQALFEGEDTREEVQARLAAIAPVAAWRNVFVFAAGRCFAEHKRRDRICTICENLNNGDLGGPVAKEICAGSLLALDILEDGMARQAPAYSKLLAERALALLDLPPSRLHERLAGQWDEPTDRVFIEQIQKRLNLTKFSARLGAWTTLLSLVGRGLPWAKEMAERNWPTDPDQEAQIFGLPSGDTALPWLSPRIDLWGPRADPRAILDVHRHGRLPRKWQIPGRAVWRSLFTVGRLSGIQEGMFSLRLPNTPGDAVIALGVTPLDTSRTELEFLLDKTQPYEHVGWLPFVEAAHFASSPSRTTLVDWLKSVRAADALYAAKQVWGQLPWPLGACAAVANSADDLKILAGRVCDGDLGDVDDWVAAELRWNEHGISEADLRHVRDNNLPFDRVIGRTGFISVWWYYSVAIKPPAMEHACRDLAALCDELPRSPMRASLAETIKFVLVRNEMNLALVLPSLSVATLRGLCVDSEFAHVTERFVDACFETYETNAELWDLLDTIGRTHRPQAPVPLSSKCATLCIRHLVQHPDRPGLLRLVAMWALGGNGDVTTLRDLKPVVNKSDEPHFREAAIVIQLAQGDLRPDEILELAAATVRVNNEKTNAIASATKVISAHQLFDPATEGYLLELLSRAAGQPHQDIKLIIDLLNDCFRRRRSELGQEKCWRELSLPKKLVPLLSGNTE